MLITYGRDQGAPLVPVLDAVEIGDVGVSLDCAGWGLAEPVQPPRRSNEVVVIETSRVFTIELPFSRFPYQTVPRSSGRMPVRSSKATLSQRWVVCPSD